MKNVKKVVLVVLIACFTLVQVGCHGSYKFTKMYYNFVESVGNKYLQSIVFTFILGAPVYAFTSFVDVVILNLIEFWTGSNPVAMKEGDKETQIIKGKNGFAYEVTATKNRFDVVQLDGEKKGEKSALVFDVNTKSWISIDNNDKKIVLMTFDFNKKTVKLMKADGSYAEKDINESLYYGNSAFALNF